MRTARIIGSLLVLLALACTSQEEKIEKHHTAAFQYFEDEEWSEAKIEFLNLLQLTPDDAEAHYKMAETLWNLEEYGEALWQYNETARLAPDNTEWRMKVAKVEFTARRYDSAAEHIAAVLEQDPNNVEALLLRGAQKSVKGDFAGLMEDVDKALELDPESKSALSLKAQALSRSGDSTGAEEYMRRLLKVEPTMANHLSLARYLALLQRPEEALVEMRAAVDAAEDKEQKTNAQFFLANFHLNQRKSGEAEKVLLSAKADDPANPKILQALAKFYYTQGDKEKAVSMLEENVQQHPEDVEPVLVLAEYHRQIGAREEALETIQRALDLDPMSEQARLRRSEMLVVPNEDGTAEIPEEAWSVVRQVLEENPKSTMGLFNEGKFFLLESKYEEAATSLRRVIDEQPTANAHVLLGSAYMAMKQDDLARSEYLSALQLDAQNYPARSQLAVLYLRTGENELAARESKTGLTRNPNDMQLRLTYAEALIRLDRQHEARDVLKGVGDAGVDVSTTVKLHIARLLRRSRDRDGARKLLEGMLKADPTSEDVMREIIAVDVTSRDPEKALDRLDEWIIDQPDNPALYDLRGRVRLSTVSGMDMEKADAIEADLKMSLSKGSKRIEPLVSLAELYRSLGRVDDAVETYKRARDSFPEDASVRLQLAVLYESLLRTEEAKASYEEVLKLDESQPEAKNNLAWLLANAQSPTEKQLDRALQLAQDAKEALPGNPSVTDTLGWIMYKKGIPAAAISLFREAIEGYPEAHPLRGTVRYHLAKSYEDNGETGRAISELRRALDEVASFAERKDAEELLEKLEKS
ncbi:MAG: tetratricopeptide repeat protein [bacterium]|nr:tetratricopeptide repeat protein [bacterium]